MGECLTDLVQFLAQAEAIAESAKGTVTLETKYYSQYSFVLFVFKGVAKAYTDEFVRSIALFSDWWTVKARDLPDENGLEIKLVFLHRDS